MQRPTGAILIAFAAAGLAAHSATAADQVKVQVPDGVPLEVVASEFDGSDFESRGSALVIELAGSIRFRHRGPLALRAVTLAVDAHREMLGGRAAVSVPSLNARDGDEFRVPINLRLLRALPRPTGPVVRIVADSVLFDTLASAGPDRLDAVGRMRSREMEARRDREFFLSRFRNGGREALATAMQASLRRQATRPRLDIRLAGAGPSTAEASARSREIRLAFVQDGDAPLVFEGGSAQVTGAVSDSPRIQLRNRGAEAVRQFDVGWLARDADGTVYSLGSAPSSGNPRVEADRDVVIESASRFEFRLADGRTHPRIEWMGAYLRSAQLEDGSLWIPSRQSLEESRLLQALPVSAEERRLAELYRTRGPSAVLDELQGLSDGPNSVGAP